jgi:glycosyltransferase involved in cell wall biosynthesis
MRVGLDVRYLSHGLTGGIHSSLLNLARTLPLVAPNEEFVFYADRKAPIELPPHPANVTVRVLPWSSPLSTLVNDRRLASWMDRDGIDVAHHPANYGRRGRQPTVVTLHDTINLFSLRDHLPRMARHPRRLATTLYLAAATRQTLKAADRLIAPSEHARQDIAARSSFPIDRIDVTPWAADAGFSAAVNQPRKDAVRRALGLHAQVIVADGIKNPAALVRAFGSLPQTLRLDASVLFFSREPRPRPDVARALDGHIRFVARPATEDLAVLFALADVFVFPSWYEGFGLPLVEAMQCGAPVIGSTRGSIPEVLGGAGLLFDVEDEAALTRHLAAILESETLRATLRSRSLARAASFSWPLAARLTLDAYRRALDRR